MLRVRTRVVPCIAGVLTLVGAGIVPVATASAATRHAPRTLRQGMRGTDVRALQSALSQAGFRTPATGRFTPATTRTVRRFERFYDMRADGAMTPGQVAELAKIVKLDRAGVDADGSGGGGITGPTSSPTKTKTTTKTKSKATTTSDPTQALNSPILAPVVQNGGSQHLGQRTLRKGMHGHDVRVLQSYLTLAGYSTSVDGQYGTTTYANVVKFEQANAITANGVVTYAQTRVLREVVYKAVATAGPVSTATLNADGTVTAPSDAPAVVQQIIAAANSIIDTPYIYGGGHQSFQSSGYDCSGAVSYALHGGGLLSSPEDSTGLETWGSAGTGQWITVYANSGHAFIVVAGLAFDTAHYGATTPSGSGPRWLPAADALANLNDGTGGYTARHPAGL